MRLLLIALLLVSCTPEKQQNNVKYEVYSPIASGIRFDLVDFVIANNNGILEGTRVDGRKVWFGGSYVVESK